jgi:hypothetical protein
MIETINSVISSLSFDLSDNDSKLSETFYKIIILNINTNDSLIFSINFTEFYFDLKKLDYNCSKENNFYSLAKIEYCSFLD